MSVPIYALLIGAEFYFPNLTEQGTMFRSLQGCVRDITRVEKELLTERLQVPPERILKLRASNTGAKEPPEPPGEWPTYENITAKFQELIKMAEPQSQVYIHYSGHGGRATTIWKDLKGQQGIDETLVPINIEDVAVSRYMRDLELARLLRAMVDKELIVTLVLDSCHSGGMTRGGGNDIAVRGVPAVDERVRPLDERQSAVASRDELIDNWQEMRGAATRSMKASSGWLPEPKGYVMLAACKETESAVEYTFNGTDRCGALTHWLLHSLQDLGPHVSWKTVHDRILSKINSQFAQQTPQVEGEVSRQVFGLTQIPPAYTVRVLQYEQAQQRVELNTGAALGASLDAGYAIFPAGTSDFTDAAKRLGVVQLSTLGATKSWAKITESGADFNVQGGEQAVLIDSGVAAVRGRVRLVAEPPPPPEPARAAALLAVENMITKAGKGFLKVVGEKEAANYQVAVSANGEYEILDAQGNAFTNLRPPVGINNLNGAETIVGRLKHLYKFHTVEQLKNPDIFSPLAGTLLVEAFKAPAGAQSFAPPTSPPESLASPGGELSIVTGESFYLHIKNNSSSEFNIAILDLDHSDWSITQVLPSPDSGSDTRVLGKKEEVWLVFTARLGAGYQQGRETLKVFASLSSASFRFLELPALDKPFVSFRTRGGLVGSVLEQLFAEFNDDQPRTRQAVLEVAASAGWTLGEVTLHLRQPAQPAAVEASGDQGLG
jgi:hypothetical protein